MSTATADPASGDDYGGDYPARMHVHEYYRPSRRRQYLTITHLTSGEGMDGFRPDAQVLSRSRGSFIMLTDAPESGDSSSMTVALYTKGDLMVETRVTRRRLDKAIAAWAEGDEFLL
ncbi:hypothetical protein [Microbacterium marinilacus]|uniref:Uncharacterized protein n=1 Tax=Microbacterium marinilacus TaxID=415209 RepID=A0ABP7BGV0_9MICO|nr:hypothetical protein [Microbacterium marinilacus]MBY0690504.1 hypothetical protein [Microbacterium marinilacus]